VLSFERHDLPIDLPAVEAFRNRGNGNDEFTLPELVRFGGSAATPEKLRDAARANFHFRMVEVAMMLLLPLLAVALAVPPSAALPAWASSVDRDGGDLPQDQSICRADGRAGPVRSGAGAVDAFCLFRRLDLVDVLDAGAQAGRAADRRPGTRFAKLARPFARLFRPRRRAADGALAPAE
jgi:lipopolysaccharide export system permease protein